MSLIYKKGAIFDMLLQHVIWSVIWYTAFNEELLLLLFLKTQTHSLFIFIRSIPDHSFTPSKFPSSDSENLLGWRLLWLFWIQLSRKNPERTFVLYLDVGAPPTSTPSQLRKWPVWSRNCRWIAGISSQSYWICTQNFNQWVRAGSFQPISIIMLSDQKCYWNRGT